MRLLQFLNRIFSLGPKRGYSLRGFWGEIRHFNKDGVQIGYTIRGFWGQRKRYDMNGNLISYTLKNFWGGYNTYDAGGNLIRRSYRNFWGGYNTYNRYGKKIQESYRNFWNVMNHFDVEDPDEHETFTKGKQSSSNKAFKSAPVPKPVKKTQSTGTRAASSYQAPYKEPGSSVVHHSYGDYQTTTISRPEKSLNVNVDSATLEKSQKESRKQQEKKNVADQVTEHSSVAKKVEEPKNMEPVANEHAGVAVESHAKSGTYNGQQLKDSMEFYSSTAEYLQGRTLTDYAKILAFKFGRLEEFPAIAYLQEGMVCVEPLIKDAEPFYFDASEIRTAKLVHVTDVDMGVLDNEFYTLSVSDLGNEFEDLLPEYPFGNDGIYRTQYVFDCGLVVTEKSMEELRKLTVI